MVFLASIKTPDGRKERRAVEAQDRAAAMRILRAEAAAVISLEERDAAPGAAAPAGRKTRRRTRLLRPRGLDVEFGLRQLSSMLRSGLSLLIALRTSAEQARTRRAARVWTGLGDEIETGVTLCSAMEESRCFDPYTLALVRMGEQSGELDATLERAAEHMGRRREMRMMLVNALIYPALVVLMTLGVVGFIVLRVIPQIQSFLAQSNQALPAMTQMLLDISLAVREHGRQAAAGILAAVLALFLARRTPRGREQTDRLALFLPVSGRILRLSATAAAARGLAILLDSGVSLLDSLETAAALIRNRRLRRRLTDAREAVIRGETLAGALAAAPEFMPMLAKMTAVGEATGTLGATLGEIARFHEMLLENAVRRFGALIEPVLILVVGGIVGFVYTAFFLALFSIATAA